MPLFVWIHIAEGPVSVTTLGGTNALFHCNGSGTVLVWEVNGLPQTDQNKYHRGIIVVTYQQ